jgi:SsrA-binding protein
MSALAENKRAYFDYEILETYEAGLQLTGAEVKSAKSGHINLKGSYVTISHGQATVLNMHIAKYAKAGSQPGYDPYRTRNLLLHKKQIAKLIGKKEEQGVTLLPLRAYVKNNRVKLAIGLGRGKKKQDKRRSIKEREIKRSIKRSYGV